MQHRLEAGIVYTWTVTALKDGHEVVAPAPPARAEFKILGKPDLLKLKLTVRRATSDAARGVLYAKTGLLVEAELEFHAYLADHPEDHRVRALLKTVRSWRGIQP